VSARARQRRGHGICDSFAVTLEWLLPVCCKRILRPSWAS
jgi:hypothetical protein